MYRRWWSNGLLSSSLSSFLLSNKVLLQGTAEHTYSVIVNCALLLFAISFHLGQVKAVVETCGLLTTVRISGDRVDVPWLS